MNLPDDTRDVLKLFGSGTKPGPLMTVLKRQCEVRSFGGWSPAIALREERQNATRIEEPPRGRTRAEQEVYDQMVAANRRRWEEEIEKAQMTYDSDELFAEIMSANFKAIRELTHVDEAVIVAQIQDLLHSDDDDLRASGIRLFRKYETSHLVARQRAAADRITKARSFLLIEGDHDIDELRKRMGGAAKVLDRVLDDLENERA